MESKDEFIHELKEKLKISQTQVLPTPELAEMEMEKDHLQQRILLLNSQIINLKQDNEALSKKLNQAPAVEDPPMRIAVEKANLSTEEIVASMSQINLRASRFLSLT